MNKNPIPKILIDIALFTMKWFLFLGLSFIILGSGGSDANAPAAKVSIIKFTHKSWVTVNGNLPQKIAPMKSIVRATTLIVSWKSINLLLNE